MAGEYAAGAAGKDRNERTSRTYGFHVGKHSVAKVDRRSPAAEQGMATNVTRDTETVASDRLRRTPTNDACPRTGVASQLNPRGRAQVDVHTLPNKSPLRIDESARELRIGLRYR